MAKTRFAADLENCARLLKTDLGRKSLPIKQELFAELSIKDLRWLNHKLSVDTRNPILYWSEIYIKYNLAVIKRREVQKWREVETLLIGSDLPQKLIGQIAFLFIYFRLNEIDSVSSILDRVQRRKTARRQMRRLKKTTPDLIQNIKAVDESVTGLLQDLADFNQDPIGPLLDELRPLQLSNAKRTKALTALSKAIQALPDDAEPQLLQDIDQLFYPNAKVRTYEYSVEEKSALVAIEFILLGAGYTPHKAASYIADIWDKQGPVRESWDFENRMHAVRRLLNRMKNPKS